MTDLHDALAELHAIAALCCEATGEERGTRSALECVEAALASLRLFDARKLLRCPECGSEQIKLNLGVWWCLGCHSTSFHWRYRPLAALLDWHGRKP